MKKLRKPKFALKKVSITVSLPDGSVCNVVTNDFRCAVWQTLKAINTKFNRPVSVAEATRAYIETHGLTVSPIELKRLKDAVGQALKFLARHKLIFGEKQNKRRTFGCAQAIDPNSAAINKPPLPVYQRILTVVRETVAQHGRAVRCRDVIEHARICGMTEISPIQIMNNMWAMTGTGELKVADRMRGDGYGRTLFLPSEMNLSELDGDKRLVFADLVVRALNQLWEEQIGQTKISADSMRPIPTAAIRKRVNQMPETNLFRRRRDEITSVLSHLAQKSVPEVRCFAQSNRLKLWAPADFEDGKIDFENTYSSNALKIRAAIERAYIKVGKRPITLREINKEILEDKNLTLTGYLSLSQYLSIITQRQKSDADGKGDRRKFTPQIRSLGSIGNCSYFAPLEAAEKESIAYVEFQRLKRRWKELCGIENLPLILNCS